MHVLTEAVCTLRCFSDSQSQPKSWCPQATPHPAWGLTQRRIFLGEFEVLLGTGVRAVWGGTALLRHLHPGAWRCLWDLGFKCNTHCWVQATTSQRARLCSHGRAHSVSAPVRKLDACPPALPCSPPRCTGYHLPLSLALERSWQQPASPLLSSSPCHCWTRWGFEGYRDAMEDR